MKTVFQLFLLMIGVNYSLARLDIEVRLSSYSNPSSEDCDGLPCDIVGFITCDNEFNFCLAQRDSGVCSSNVITSGILSDDSFTFGALELSQLSISNPLLFSDFSTTTGLDLGVRIYDYDPTILELVDVITIPFDDEQRANSEFSSITTSFGDCGRAGIRLSISITNLCPTNTYGPECDVFCEEVPGNNTCNYLGEVLCEGNFREPDCTECEGNFQLPNCNTCIQDYYPQGVCNVFCQPRNDTTGHFTCDSNGNQVCLPGYTDPGTDCVTCIGNFREPDCIECDPNFQGPNCNTCIQDYYPQGTCNVFCQPRNDATGHFTCDSNGNKVCLPRYADPSTNCVTCIGNFQEPNCTECDPNFQGPNCNTCFPGYTGTNCDTCIGNFQEPDCTECDDNFQAPNCSTCIQEYYPQGICNIMCQPRNDASGRFTCDNVTGEIICLPGYENPSRNCLDRDSDPDTEGGTSGSVFFESELFFAIAAVVGVILLFCVLCTMCTLWCFCCCGAKSSNYDKSSSYDNFFRCLAYLCCFLKCLIDLSDVKVEA